MATWWIEFDGRGPGCVDSPKAKDEERARALAESVTGKKALRVDRLPYPAAPVLHQEPDKDGGPVCPAFCYAPEQCRGRTACPQHYACSE